MFTVQGMQQVHRQTRASVTSGSCIGGSLAPRTVPNIQFLFLVFLYFVFCLLYFVICILYWHLYWKSFAGWKRSASNFDQNLLRMASAAAHIDRRRSQLHQLAPPPPPQDAIAICAMHNCCILHSATNFNWTLLYSIAILLQHYTSSNSGLKRCKCFV